jgi:hypothetical protein
MMTRTRITAIFSLTAFAGCSNFGHVNQGQVIDFQPSSGLVTLIGDSNYREPANPRFDVLPPVTIHVPENRGEMGPPPEAGKLLQLDWRGHRMVIFDAAAGSLRTVPYAVVSEQDGVAPDDPRVSNAAYPIVDHGRKTIASYFPRYRKLLVFSVSAVDLDLPADTWKMGDEIRYYYKNPQLALRLMNVSKTDLDKAGK